jgi:hypothetical protein
MRTLIPITTYQMLANREETHGSVNEYVFIAVQARGCGRDLRDGGRRPEH